MSKYCLLLVLTAIMSCNSATEQQLAKANEFGELLNGMRLHKHTKNIDSAKSVYSRLTRISNHDSSKSYAYFGLGEIAQQEFDTLRAYNYYDSAFSTYNKNLDALAYQASLVALTGYPDSARTYLELGMQIDSTYEGIYLNLMSLDSIIAERELQIDEVL